MSFLSVGFMSGSENACICLILSLLLISIVKNEEIYFIITVGMSCKVRRLCKMYNIPRSLTDDE